MMVLPMDPQDSALREFLAVVWRRAWWILVPTIVGVVIALTVSMRQTPIYISSAEVLVLPLRDPSTRAPLPIVIENELRIAQSVAVRNVAEDLVSNDEGTLAPVSVDNPPETETLVFEAASPDPSLASESADAYADAYLQFRAESQIEAVETAIGDLEVVIAGLNEELAEARAADDSAQTEALLLQIGPLQAELRQLELLRSTRVGEVLAPAVVPDSPSSPNHVKAVLLGGIVGLLVGLALAFLRERLDPRVRGRDDLEQVADAPLLATIPYVRKPLRKVWSGVRADPLIAEAFRALRARILFAASQRPLRTVLITSPLQGDGKTTTAASLGIALSEAGKNIVLIDADLHNRSLGAYFGVADGVGLTEVLAQPARLPEALQPTGIDDLSLIPSSSDTFTTPPGGFAVTAMNEVIEQVSGGVDLMILDSTPVLSVSDALELAPAMDGVLMVVDVGKSSRSEVEDTALQLRSVGAQILGLVATKVVPRRFRGYHYVRYDEYRRVMLPSAESPDADGEVRSKPDHAEAREDGDSATSAPS